jgi:hypothetical protein
MEAVWRQPPRVSCIRSLDALTLPDMTEDSPPQPAEPAAAQPAVESTPATPAPSEAKPSETNPLLAVQPYAQAVIVQEQQQSSEASVPEPAADAGASAVEPASAEPAADPAPAPQPTSDATPAETNPLLAVEPYPQAVINRGGLSAQQAKQAQVEQRSGQLDSTD